MNIGFFSGYIIDKGSFKFIFSKKIKHKSVYSFKLKLQDNTIIEVVCYDKMADLMIRNKFENISIIGNLILDNGKLKIQMKEIYKIQGGLYETKN